MADLDRASLKDLKRFFLDYYHPGNATLCLSGDFDPAEAKRSGGSRELFRPPLPRSRNARTRPEGPNSPPPMPAESSSPIA